MSTLSNNSTVRNAANLATVMFVLMVILQLMLAAGILPVTMAWGGREPVLTNSLRVASIISAAVMGIFAYIIRRRAGLVGDAPITKLFRVLPWILTVFLALNTLAILAGTSTGEKILFGPIALLLAVSCFVVSKSKYL